MFFIVSKLASFLTSPIIWLILLYGVTYLKKNQKLGKVLLITSVIFTIFFTNTAILQQFSHQWEKEYLKQETPSKKYNYGVVLGGMATYDTTTTRTQFSQSGDRLFQALKLFNLGVFDTLIISGGSAKIFEKERFEASFLKEYCRDIGFDESKIIADSLSRNTRENALFSSKITQTNGEVLLITSSYHLPRAEACFLKIGIKCDSFGCDSITQHNALSFDQFIIPDFNNLIIWQKLFHEWLGYLTYWAKDYI